MGVFMPKLDFTDRCAVQLFVDVIGGKWKPLIIFELVQSTRRFNELRRAIPPVTQRMLTRQLRELEGDGMVERTVYPEVPPRVEYSLTQAGKTLVPIMNQIEKWGLSFSKSENYGRWLKNQNTSAVTNSLSKRK